MAETRIMPEEQAAFEAWSSAIRWHLFNHGSVQTIERSARNFAKGAEVSKDALTDAKKYFDWPQIEAALNR